ncbi:MAG: replication initiator protein A [Acidobacteria bacterium]|nr:replication initiator protein A [Acidobacteriota bacterium]
MSKKESWEGKDHKSLPLKLVRADSSFEGLPYFLVSTGKTSNKSEIVFNRHYTYEDDDGSGSVDQRWEVRASGRLGLPGRLDQDVYMAVHELITDRGGIPESGELHFSLYELVGYLGWAGSGGHYESVSRSLRRIASTIIDCDRAFWSQRRCRFVSDTFNLWTFHRARYEEGPSGRAAERHVLRLHPLFVENYEENYLNSLDSAFYWTLKGHTSKRLYRLLETYSIGDHNAAGIWELGLLELRDLVPLAEYKYATKVKEKLSKAHKELSAMGYLKNISFRKIRRGEESVRYEVSPSFLRNRVESVIEAGLENQGALEAMRRAGIPRQVRISVLREHDPDRCMEFASLLPYQRGLKNPVAAFRWALSQPEKAQRWWEAVPKSQAEPIVSTVESCTVDDSDVTGPEKPLQGSQVPEADEAALAVWGQLLAEIDTGSLQVWFESTVPISLQEETLVLSVPNSTARDYIESRFKTNLEESLKDRLSENAVVVLTSRDQE